MISQITCGANCMASQILAIEMFFQISVMVIVRNDNCPPMVRLKFSKAVVRGFKFTPNGQLGLKKSERKTLRCMNKTTP